MSINRGKGGRYLDKVAVRIEWKPTNEYEVAMSEAMSQLELGDKCTVG